MGVAPGTIRWVINGHMPGGEEFHTGFWTTPTVPPASAAALILESAPVQVAANTFFAAYKAHYGALTGPDSLSAYWYPGFEFGDHAQFQANVPLAVNVGAGAETAPNQVSVVASLRTGTSGRSFRGRMYLPIGTPGPLTTGQLSAANTLDVATRMKTFLDAVNAGGQRVGVMSAVQTLITPVLAVRVDSVLDIQRRRAKSLVPVTVSDAILA